MDQNPPFLENASTKTEPTSPTQDKENQSSKEVLNLHPIKSHKKKIPPQTNFHQLQTYQPIEVKSPDVLLQIDTTNFPTILDFSNALFSSIDCLPEVPYDISDYKPQTFYETPSFFPPNPNMKLLQPEFFKRYDISTLFYIFFYFPGTPQQLFSGKELKQRGWKFHTQYQTWIRRVSEPVEENVGYEVATFEYFDHVTEGGNWCIRQRNSFKLEYDCLETEI